MTILNPEDGPDGLLPGFFCSKFKTNITISEKFDMPSRLPSPWKSILNRAQAKQAWKFIEKVDADCAIYDKKFRENDDVWWLDKAVGAILLSHYLYLETGEKKYKRDSIRCSISLPIF